jgi:sodium/potassium/calcium exchanger 6
MLLTGNIHKTIFGGFPIAVIILLIGLLIAGLIYKTTKYDTPPAYHWAFGYLGFVVSVTWIYGLANEVVDLLQAVGIMFNLSDVILGLTVLAWGNSLGDLISNVSMARQGFPRMGISACFGGPLLNLLLGIGLPYTFMLGENEGHMLPLEYSRMVSLLYGTVTLGLASTVIFLVFNKFEAKKSHGFFLISVYLVYMVVAVLIESELM